MTVGTIVHYFPGASPNSWHYHDRERHAGCIAAIITREPSTISSIDGKISDLAVFDKGVRYLSLPHHTDYETHEYHDYDNGSWHSLDECAMEDRS